jgi:hypothetical protein
VRVRTRFSAHDDDEARSADVTTTSCGLYHVCGLSTGGDSRAVRYLYSNTIGDGYSGALEEALETSEATAALRRGGGAYLPPTHTNTYPDRWRSRRPTMCIHKHI